MSPEITPTMQLCRRPCVTTGPRRATAVWAHDDNGSNVGWGNQVVGVDLGAAFVAGVSRSLGLKADRSIAAWGRNYHAECNVPGPNTDFVVVAVGRPPIPAK